MTIPGYSILHVYSIEVSITHYLGHISLAMHTYNARGYVLDVFFLI